MRSVSNFFKALYSLDTLDTRFTTSATAPAKTKEHVSQDPVTTRRSASPLPDARPSKWNTPEFYVYYVAFITIVPLMFKAVYDVSNPGSPGWDRYSKLLSPGWIPGRKVDNSDAQYASFRDNIPAMTLVLILHPLLRRFYGAFWRIDSYTQVPQSSSDGRGLSHGLSPTAAANARLEHRVSFDLMFAFVFVVALHGISAIKVFLILYTNYKIATQLPRSYVPAATWIFNIGILFANELCHGYPLASVANFLLPSTTTAKDNPAPGSSWAAWLDSYGGILPRWEILFNLTVLRLISFNLDHYWARAQSGSNSVEKKQLDPSSLSERDRVTHGASAQDFTLRNYFAYTLYSPLYLTGPIITFNDYISQSRYPLPTITPIRTFLYGIRFLLVLLTMEFVLHFLYAVAISKSSPDWSAYSPFQLSMIAYFNLHIIWLKLLIPWRFFRLWSLIDRIDPPENMVRCMSDNYSALAFWRGWHRSLNRWIVRYIYIPLGGGGGGNKLRGILNFAIVFTFVALWHDINLRLLWWSWLIVFFVLPETVATIAFPKRKWRDFPETYRVLCGIGAVGNVLMMMVANLVGFALGIDGIKSLVKSLVADWTGRGFVAVACATLFVGVQVMFEHREQEKRRGVSMKC
ncbi:MBOAT-domain-containing protein [Myriangium duriaei CBS 260.36]|uniref:MBOAT-domain-containing protein n=1 Tax=Myriangium duriaei CBS 260.36 TaxID=1168546 RepID=A0A9P4MDG0_9PEZI|nr:MBOAT-domain-containing protein [Myriangium duriaei CBS 260.36]